MADAPTDPLVLLPGTLCDARLWSLVLKELDMSAQVIVLANATNTREMARRVLDEAPARFALAGFSLGGIVALEVVAQAPERVSRLALIDTNPLPDPPESQARRHAAADQARADGIGFHVTTDLLPHYFAGRRPDLEALALDMAGSFDSSDYAQQCQIAATRSDSRPRLGAIVVPVLVLCGADDRLCPPDVHRALVAAIPGADLVEVPDAGHFTPLEAPVAVARAMRLWLQRS